MTRWILALMILATPTMAQPSTQPDGKIDQTAIDEAVRRGTVATLAHICGLREEAWAFDLRRATILDTTHATRPDDDTLRQAAGSQIVTTAMTYAETEALEDFAEAPASVTCDPLKRNPELTRADAIVAAFRTLKAKMKPTS